MAVFHLFITQVGGKGVETFYWKVGRRDGKEYSGIFGDTHTVKNVMLI